MQKEPKVLSLIFNPDYAQAIIILPDSIRSLVVDRNQDEPLGQFSDRAEQLALGWASEVLGSLKTESIEYDWSNAA